MLLVADREAAEAAFRAHAPEVRPLVPGALVREAEEQPGVHHHVALGVLPVQAAPLAVLRALPGRHPIRARRPHSEVVDERVLEGFGLTTCRTPLCGGRSRSTLTEQHTNIVINIPICVYFHPGL